MICSVFPFHFSPHVRANFNVDFPTIGFCGNQEPWRSEASGATAPQEVQGAAAYRIFLYSFMLSTAFSELELLLGTLVFLAWLHS